jgi:hypothetical protein
MLSAVRLNVIMLSVVAPSRVEVELRKKPVWQTSLPQSQPHQLNFLKKLKLFLVCGLRFLEMFLKASLTKLFKLAVNVFINVLDMSRITGLR